MLPVNPGVYDAYHHSLARVALAPGGGGVDAGDAPFHSLGNYFAGFNNLGQFHLNYGVGQDQLHVGAPGQLFHHGGSGLDKDHVDYVVAAVFQDVATAPLLLQVEHETLLAGVGVGPQFVHDRRAHGGPAPFA